MRRFLALTATLCSFALVGSGLSPAAAAPAEEPDPAAGTVAGAGQTDTRPDAVSAQVTAKATGHRVEDLSQRSTTTQVFANPDGTWAMESFTLPRFRAADDGTLVPIKDAGTFTDAGTAFTGAGAEITVSDGGEPGRAGSVPLVELTGTGEDADRTLVLGWEGALPEPEIDGAQAVYDDGVQVTVQETAPSATPGAGQDPQDTGTAAPTPDPAAGAEESADARVVVEPTRTGFLHTVVLDQAPDGDVVLRFPLDFSAGLKAELNPENSEIRVKDRDGDTVFHAPTPLMWDAKTNEASGLPAAETPVDTELLDEDGTQVLVLRADRAWLNDPAREYPVTIDPAWSGAAGGDTWVQSGSTVGHGGSTELRVGTYDGGATKARSYMKFSVQKLTGKKILKAEVRLNNHYSYSCTSSEIRLQRVGAAWDTNALVWTGQPVATTTGQGTNTQSKGYSSACAAGSVLFPATPIVQHWADNPTQNFGVRIIATDETNSNTWKRYRSNDHVSGSVDPVEPHLLVTYNSYPDTAPAPAFGTGQSSTHTAGSATTTYVKTLKPDFRAMVTDPDKGNVTAQFEVVDSNGTKVLDKVGGTTVPSGSTSVLKGYTASLTNGRTYTATAWSHDGTLRSPAAGPATTFTVDTTAPAAPTVTSTAYTDNGWLQTRPAANTFTFASTATDTAKFQHSKDGGAWTDVDATGTNPRTAALDWNPYSAHQLRVRAVDKAGNISQERTFTFMNGLAALTAPAAGTTTTDAFRVQAKAPASGTGTVTPTVYWRPAQTADGKDNSTYGSADNLHGWLEAQELDPVAPSTEVRVDTTLDIAASPTDRLKDLGKERVAALVEIQVCFAYAGQTGEAATQCSTNSTHDATAVTRLPHAFGNDFPVAEAGDGQVALTTGELNLSETDVNVDAGNTGLSISRSYSSYSGIGANSRIFGKGWRANIDGPEAGLAGLLVAESTELDGTITLIGDDEAAAVFRQPGNGQAKLKTGIYVPANEDATASGWRVEVIIAGTGERIRITEADGTATTFKKGANLENNAKIWEWVAETVSGGNTVGVSRFVSDQTGRITQVVAGTESTPNCDITPAKGCRVLNLAYDAAGKVTKVTYTAWDTAKNAVDTVPIAEYTYDGTSLDAKLLTVKDSRTGDVTTYGYGENSAAGVPLLTSSTERSASQALIDAPTYYEYGRGNNASGRPDWLEAVKRGKATDGSDKVQLARFVYGVDPAGDDKNLPDLSPTRIAHWDQDQEPRTGYAVFGPGKEITTSKPEGDAAANWKFADLQYVDATNRVVNTSSYAAGAWQSTAQVFNQDGNVIRSYDARGIRNITARQGDASLMDNGVLKSHEDYASLTYYFGRLGDFLDEDGVGRSSETDPAKKLAEQQKNEATAEFLRGYATHTYSPVTTDETGQQARVHTRTDYTGTDDVDAGGMPRMLVTASTTTQAASGSPTLDPSSGEPVPATETVLSATKNGYDAFEPDADQRPTGSKENKRSGWVVGSPTTVTTLMGAGAQNDIATETRFDDQGRVKETRQPKSAGGDAGATTTVYYTAAANTSHPDCGSSPQFAGYLCKTTPGGPGSVKKHQTDFNIYGQPSRVTESSTGTDGASRTTSQTYRADGQQLKTTVTTTGLAGSTAVPATENLYDGRGVQTGIRAAGQPDVLWTQDLWGRTVSYTNSLNETTRTEYDDYGNVSKTVTPKATTTFKYGALSGDGDTEYQGVVTEMTISNHGGPENGTYRATYDGDGNILTQEIPGDFAQINDYDPATGAPIGLSYTGPVKDQDGNTSTGPWISWSTIRDVTGRIVGENTPDRDLLSGTATAGDRAAQYDKSYEYDRAGRLTQVTDLTGQPGEAINTDPGEGETATPGTVRTYAFDKNGNRTSLTTTHGTTATPKTWAYDAADRVTGDYVYDGLGRQTTIPAKDAPKTATTAAGTGDIKIGYYDTDAARTIARGGVTTTIGLDPAGRRLTLTSSGGSSQETKHYTDDSDNPAWTTRLQGTTTVTTRYESTIGGDLALTITDGTVELAVNNPHGDTVTTIPLTGDEAGQGIKGWAQYDEYGNQITDPVGTGATTYGWHGADQRALDASGLILMGARLYNSATGLFTSRDPVDGGNSTTYAHPQDPVNKNDITGRAWWETALNVVSIAAIFIPGGVAVSLGIRLAFMGIRYASHANSVYGVYKGARDGGWRGAAKASAGFIPGIGKWGAAKRASKWASRSSYAHAGKASWSGKKYKAKRHSITKRAARYQRKSQRWGRVARSRAWNGASLAHSAWTW